MKRSLGKCRFVLCFLCLLAAPLAAGAQEITIAAASDLQFVLPEAVARFQNDTGRTVRLTFGSSGNFFSQIQSGAPFDLFFSADGDYPKKLEAAGLTEPGTLYEYATGRIVLWVRSDSKIDVRQGLTALLDPGVRKIAVANPQHAPYGRAAVAALKHENLYDRVREKLVLGENISQTAQFVESGNADIGVLALSLVVAPAMKQKGRYFEIAQDDYPAIHQAAVLLASSHDKPAARQFLDYLKQPQLVALFERYGFTVPNRSLEAKP